MQTTRIHELIEKGYKENGLLDRIIFVYPSSKEIADWQLDEDSSFATFEKYSAMWESIIDKVVSLPLQRTRVVEIHKIFWIFLRKPKPILLIGVIMQFELSIKFKMTDW